ncbi:MAG: 4-alpha-glucanotransferase, partial [Chloroflexi bacterium]|nr:4-alpha-glucanotransferase [Chloroflexota bacterium]
MTDQPRRRPARAAGILLHPTSLPSPHGVGDLGAGVYRFVEFLGAARQTLWQVMPLGPVGMGNSPYAARSAFVGNPLLIALDQLAGRGWVAWSDLAGPGFPLDRVEYGAATDFKLAVLGRAFERFDGVASADDRADFERFREQERGWLDDYALFMALREVHGGRGWWDWAPGVALREPEALAAAHRDLDKRVRFHQFGQWIFARQWAAARRYANERGIRVIGDIPIFVAHDSVDVWAHRELFHLDAAGRPTVVAGVPPDYFSVTGQRWGNPLYDWARMAEEGYRWWIERFRATLGQFDVVRLDHFRGFQAYWEVPAEQETALHGRWVDGPREALFDAVAAELGRVPMIVEDLGEITPDVIELRDRLGFPGLKVLQFAFAEDARAVPTGRNAYLPHNYEPNAVVYTGTHDNDTTVGWFSALGDDERAAGLRYVGTDGRDIAWDLIRLAFASVAQWAIVPLQDVLGLGSQARMNVPGRPDGNWAWR